MAGMSHANTSRTFAGGEEKKRKGKEKMTKEKVQWLNKARLQSPRLLSFSLLLLPSSPSHHVASTLARNSKSRIFLFEEKNSNCWGRKGA